MVVYFYNLLVDGKVLKNDKKYREKTGRGLREFAKGLCDRGYGI